MPGGGVVTISELITMLEGAKEKHGDVQVWIRHEWDSPLINTFQFTEESFHENWKEYWPSLIILDDGSYDHKAEYEKRKK